MGRRRDICRSSCHRCRKNGALIRGKRKRCAIKLLLVEDEEGIAEAVRRGLEKARYDVDVAGTGAEGLALAGQGGYSLLILDVMLPGIDGCQVCERLRRLRNALPVLMLTARDAVSDRVRGLEAGADDYLIKPFEFAELLARVRALLRRDKVHRTRMIEIGDLCIDTTAPRVSRAGKQIALTPGSTPCWSAWRWRRGACLHVRCFRRPSGPRKRSTPIPWMSASGIYGAKWIRTTP